MVLPLGLGLANYHGCCSGYRLWPAYRRSADYYLEFILKPLLLPDLICGTTD